LQAVAVAALTHAGDLVAFDQDPVRIGVRAVVAAERIASSPKGPTKRLPTIDWRRIHRSSVVGAA
jgi:hypothetical protein